MFDAGWKLWMATHIFANLHHYFGPRLYDDDYVYRISRVRGRYLENIRPKSWQYKKDRAPLRSRASYIDKKFIVGLKLFRKNATFSDCKKEKEKKEKKQKT